MCQRLISWRPLTAELIAAWMGFLVLSSTRNLPSSLFVFCPCLDDIGMNGLFRPFIRNEHRPGAQMLVPVLHAA